MVKVNNKKRIFSDQVNKKRAPEKKPGSNPFEVHINKQKHQVLGQKLKNDRGLPGVSRAKALKRRKHTLLQEYNVHNKSNKFVDKRIGEKNHSMSSEDRQMARFTAERMRSHNRKSIYNLADEEVLTHRGQTLSEIEKFDDPRSDDDDDDDMDGRKATGKLDDSFVEDAHFGGGILKKSSSDGAKSHKDLIEQLIAESKKRKAEKQKLREQTIELTEKLDSEWKDLLPLVNRSKKEDTNERNLDPYDKVMRELRFEARGNPADRLKSEEEIAKEEKEKLEKLEEDRLRRMRGVVEENETKAKHRSADDLDDGFAYDSEPETTLAYNKDGTCMIAPEKKEEEKSEDEKSDEEKEPDSDEESEDENTDDDLSDLKQSESESSDEEISNMDAQNIENVSENSEEETSESSEEEVSENSEEDNSEKNRLNSKKPNVLNKKRKTEELIDKTEAKKKKEDKSSKKKVADKSIKETIVETITKISDENTKNCNGTIELDMKLSNLEKKSPKLETKSQKLGTKLETESLKLDKKSSVSLTKASVLETNSTKLETESSELETNSSEENSSDEEKVKETSKKFEDIQKIRETDALKEAAAKELPYTFKVPETYEDLQTLLENQLPEYQSVILERMIKCNHPNVSNGNKESLERIFVYLIQHLTDLADEPKKCMAVLVSLLPQIYDLVQLNKQGIHGKFIELLKELHENYLKTPKKYPGVEMLAVLKLVGSIFPTSDFKHQVVTPTFVFIGEMLTNCRVRTRNDIAYGLFIVTMTLEYINLSKRFIPAVINHLAGLLHMAIPKTGVQLIKVIPPFKSTSTTLVLPQKTTCNDLRMKTEDFIEEKVDNDFKVRALYTTVKLVEEFYEKYSHLSCCDVIFKPLLNFMERIPEKFYPDEVQMRLRRVKTMIGDGIKNRKLCHIVLPAKKPKALRLYEPNIVKIVEGKNHKVMSKEKAEKSKLLHKYKKEMKGALREIRRDKSFLGRVKLKEKIQSDRERKEKVKKIYSEASIQQSELNAISRKKKSK